MTEDQSLPLKVAHDVFSPPSLSPSVNELSAPPYGNSATKLLESQSKPSVFKNNGHQGFNRPTISTYRHASSNAAQPVSPFSQLPTSPPYTAGHHGSSLTRSLPPNSLLVDTVDHQSCADDGDSSDENESTRKQTSVIRKYRENEEHCQVFAKTSFDPFSADGYRTLSTSSELSVKLPKVTSQGEQHDASLASPEEMDDSARRGIGGVDDALGSGKGEMQIGGLDPETDESKLREGVTEHADIYAMVGKYLNPHGIAIVIFYDHRAAGLIYQAIQCHALQLPEESDRIYVKFLQVQEIQKVLGEAIRPCLNNNEAKVCITFDSSTELIFPPIEQLKLNHPDHSLSNVIDVVHKAFLAVFCDSRIGPVAISRLNQKFIGNAQLHLTLTDFHSESGFEAETSPVDQAVIDSSILTKHLATVTATSGFEPDVFKTQTWICATSSHADPFSTASKLDSHRAPFTIPTDERAFRQISDSSSLLDSPEWNRTTVFGTPFTTPSKTRLPSSTERLAGSSENCPFTAAVPQSDLNMTSDLRTTSMTLIEQLNEKFSRLHNIEEDATLQGEPKWVHNEVTPFGPPPTSHSLFETSSLPITPRKSNPAEPSSPRPFTLSSLESSPVRQATRQSYSLETTPKYVAQLAQKARQIEIMKNVPREMMINIQALKTGQSLFCYLTLRLWLNVVR
ncbi:hypothetical protein QFC19_001647 [Naganishia cerealis]|uniref:Uncharacterized protein n=1 Tax=Naganishia cerealis TaxID=610337 RepID=A0ACC2WER4_9TREE|nr:hypothetical protein QFC19_001647 [Naganishia cerealis]